MNFANVKSLTIPEGKVVKIYTSSGLVLWKMAQDTSDVPTLKVKNTWYQGATQPNTFTKIEFVDSYTPTGAETEYWYADTNNNGDITCYVNGSTLIIAGNGSGAIKLGNDCDNMFNLYTYDTGLNNVITITGLSLLDTSNNEWFQNSFSGLHSLTELDLSTWDTSKVVSFHGMFDTCVSLTQLNLSNFDTSRAYSMCNMFWGCGSLTELDLSSFDTSGVSNMNSMFTACSSLTELDLTNFNTSNVDDMCSMFFNCSNLTDIYGISTKWIVKDECNTSEMFNGCGTDHITFIDIVEPDEPDVPTPGNYPTFTDGDKWYKGTTPTTAFTLIEFVDSYTPTGEEDESWYADENNNGDITCYVVGTELIIAGNGSGGIYANPRSVAMFFNFENIININNLSLLDTSKVQSMSYMFDCCVSLTSLNLSNFDTSNVTTMYGMFSSCYNITSLDLTNFNTNKVITMEYMFSNCQSLTQITVLSTKFVINENCDTDYMFMACGTDHLTYI